MNFDFNTPILYLIFNRLDIVKQTFQEIAKVKPKQLFIASDGARNQEEKMIVDKVRKYVLDNIDWDCEVKTLFRDKNLGCKFAITTAIDWFFNNVEQGIILEDDCLPDPNFFRFCQEMLERYKDKDKVMSIGGNSPLGKFKIKDSYLFSKDSFTWGWATWKESWDKIDLELDEYKKVIHENNLKEYYPLLIERILRRKRANDYLNGGKTDIWDMQWSISLRLNKCLSIIPKNNLIKNIGFCQESTHTIPNKWDIKYLDGESYNLDYPLKHPLIISPNKIYARKEMFMQLKRIILKRLL
jgi:hypothetical protein